MSFIKTTFRTITTSPIHIVHNIQRLKHLCTFKYTFQLNNSINLVIGNHLKNTQIQHIVSMCKHLVTEQANTKSLLYSILGESSVQTNTQS